MSKALQRREVDHVSGDGNAQSVKSKPPSLVTLAGGLVALSTLVGFLLHGCGHVAYSSYLHEWGVDDTLFPKGTDWKVVNGYSALLLRGTDLLTDFPLPLAFGALLTLTGCLFLYRMPVPPKTKFSAWFIRRHVLIQELARSFAISAFTLYVTFSFLIMGLAVALVPGWIGHTAGRQQAQQQIEKASRGEDFSYVELWRDETMYASGSAIAVSDQLIAMYDHRLGRARVFDRTPYEIRSLPRKRE